MAIRLKQEGEEDFVLLERAGDIGGTWRDNTYPGCRCDVPSHLYSFSFAPNPNWSSTFSPQEEILDYLKDCAERFGVLPHVRFDTELESAEWDDAEGLWRIETSTGPMTANFLVAAQGPLSRACAARGAGPRGLRGHGLPLGAVGPRPRPDRRARGGDRHRRVRDPVRPGDPAEGRQAARLPAHGAVGRARTATGRSERWERTLYRLFPPAQRAMRAGIYWARELFVLLFRHPPVNRLLEQLPLRHMRSQIKDPELRRKLTPGYSMGCKRILPTDEWYPALAQPNVELVTGGVTEIRPHSVVAEDGTEREVDTIIFGTGFHVTDVPIADRVRGRDGRTLAEHLERQHGRVQGHHRRRLPEPVLPGRPEHRPRPHLDRLHDRVAGRRTCSSALRTMRARGADTLEVREEAQAAYNAELDRMTKGTVWVTGGCTSYYIDRNGHNSALWPTYTWPFRRQLRRFDAAAYSLGARVPGSREAPREPAVV